MEQKSKIFIGVAVVAAVLAGSLFMGGNGLKGQISLLPDLSVSSVKIADTSYNGVPYYRVSVALKNSGPEAEWKVDLNAGDYTKYMGWKKVPANTDTTYSFDILQSFACAGGKVLDPGVGVTLDPNNKIAEYNENNQSIFTMASTPCPNSMLESVTRGEAANALYKDLVSKKYVFKSTASTTPIFSDVPSSSPYFIAVQKLYAEGWIAGTSNGTFKPQQPVSRVEAAKLLTLAASQPKVWLTAPYTDIDPNSWYGGSNGVVSFIYSKAFEKNLLSNFGGGSKFFPYSYASFSFVNTMLALN
ncbi:MAG: S-layer homology domain-containing protein [Candidatus Peregrinibacteria bacterium]|nr:S-layer homology domain-containing protein [Candidatus Peregrinibacteria bacterium]